MYFSFEKRSFNEQEKEILLYTVKFYLRVQYQKHAYMILIVNSILFLNGASIVEKVSLCISPLKGTVLMNKEKKLYYIP